MLIGGGAEVNATIMTGTTCQSTALPETAPASSAAGLPRVSGATARCLTHLPSTHRMSKPAAWFRFAARQPAGQRGGDRPSRQKTCSTAAIPAMMMRTSCNTSPTPPCRTLANPLPGRAGSAERLPPHRSRSGFPHRRPRSEPGRLGGRDYAAQHGAPPTARNQQNRLGVAAATWPAIPTAGGRATTRSISRCGR